MSTEKNARIKATLLATKERRKTQKCFVFSTKINHRKLNKRQKEQLQMLFVEAKWVYNDIINHLQDNELSTWDDKKKSVMVKQNDGSFVEKPLLYFKSAMMQGMKSLVGDSLNSLAEKKKKGYKVGKLKFKSSCSSIPLKQFGHTHRIKSLIKVGITGISGNLRVHGLEQFVDNPNAEIANAKLLKKPDGYYIHWTIYIDKNKLPVIQRSDEVIGIDFGCGTSFTFSDGHKEDFKLREPECLKNSKRVWRVNSRLKPERSTLISTSPSKRNLIEHTNIWQTSRTTRLTSYAIVCRHTSKWLFKTKTCEDGVKAGMARLYNTLF